MLNSIAAVQAVAAAAAMTTIVEFKKGLYTQSIQNSNNIPN